MRATADDSGDRTVRPDFVELVKLARDGNVGAKHALVDSLHRLVWHTIADFGMSREDRQDVFAGTFCRLFERLGSIRDPDRLPGWIATTARNEAHTLLRARGRFVLTDELGERQDDDPPTDERLLDRELNAALQGAFLSLPHHCRELLRLLTAVPRLSYEEVGELLAMPHGSIGPTRQRCLERLRNAPELRPFHEGGQP
ncbi:MAG: sigma-70 family RNA polymerase sigma factor [Actinomycetota bacterium]|nr:sigma-70 family RNA polymerase sigma factor [Actinomycetota bacterium]